MGFTMKSQMAFRLTEKNAYCITVKEACVKGGMSRRNHQKMDKSILNKASKEAVNELFKGAMKEVVFLIEQTLLWIRRAEEFAVKNPESSLHPLEYSKEAAVQGVRTDFSLKYRSHEPYTDPIKRRCHLFYDVSSLVAGVMHDIGVDKNGHVNLGEIAEKCREDARAIIYDYISDLFLFDNKNKMSAKVRSFFQGRIKCNYAVDCEYHVMFDSTVVSLKEAYNKSR